LTRSGIPPEIDYTPLPPHFSNKTVPTNSLEFIGKGEAKQTPYIGTQHPEKAIGKLFFGHLEGSDPNPYFILDFVGTKTW
jgi:hypothetical protein